jgi:small subunit ribosomal protein S24e
MNVNLLSTTENKLLERKEVEAEVSFSGATPKRTQLKEAVSQKIGANPDFVVLRRVSSAFGRCTVRVIIHSYTNKEALMRTEPTHIKVREGFMPKPEKKKAAPAAKAKKKE